MIVESSISGNPVPVQIVG